MSAAGGGVKQLQAMSSLAATAPESSEDECCGRDCAEDQPVVETSRAVFKKNKYGERAQRVRLHCCCSGGQELSRGCVSRAGEVKWVNDYKMIARLGKGAFAEVNLCEKVAPNRQTEQFVSYSFVSDCVLALSDDRRRSPVHTAVGLARRRLRF
jgi:hypothetical protein